MLFHPPINRPPIPPDPLVLLGSTEGTDRITVSRMDALAKRLGAKIMWRTFVRQDESWYVAHVRESDALPLSRAFLADEDLNANLLSLYRVQMIDRYLSLPKRSAEWSLPLTEKDQHARFGSHMIPSLVSLAFATSKVRQARQEGWIAERLATSVRNLSPDRASPTGLDLFVRLWRGKAFQVFRIQRDGGRTVECGRVSQWPRSYENGVQRIGTTLKLSSGTQTDGRTPR